MTSWKRIIVQVMVQQPDLLHMHFKEMMLTVTLVHESETDAVLRAEETELLQEKLTYLDPWMKASAKGGSVVAESSKEEDRTEITKSTFEAPSPPLVSDAPSTPRRKSDDTKTKKKEEDAKLMPPPSLPGMEPKDKRTPTEKRRDSRIIIRST